MSKPEAGTIHHRHRNQVVFCWTKRTSLFTSLWLTPGCPQGVQALGPGSCWSLHPPLQHKFTGLVGAAAPPPSPHPGWWAGALPTPAETPCLFLKVSWGFQSFSSKGHYSQGGVGTLRILVPHVFKFFSITHSIRHLPLTCTYF